MEVAGLAFALVSLYTACIETVHRVESYKNFQSEARQLSAQFRADKAILQRWADKVGISHNGLSETYDRRLDGSEIGSAVKEILLSLQTLLKATEGAQSKTRHDSAGKLSSPHQLVSAPDATGATSFSSRKRDRVAWTFGGKEKFTTLVDSFGVLVGKLDDLIPIEKSLERRSLAKQSSEDTSQYRLLVERALRRFKDEDRKEFLSWISPVQNSEQYESCRACRSPNTCSWILERPSFLEWRSSSFPDDSSKSLWIHGPAGFGKSVICAAIVDHVLQDDPPRVAHHFLSSSPDHRDDITIVLRSWIAQMIEAEDQLLDTALEEVRRAPLGAARSNLWNLFTVLARDHSDWTFVLDGLDEFGFLHDSGKQDPKGDRAAFLRNLKMALLGTRNRLLVVSRDELDIRLCLSATGASIDGLSMYEHQISITDVEGDVMAFSTDVVANKLANKSDSVKVEIAETMAAKCEGMFLWIDLHQSDLRGGKNKRQLQKAIEEMPVGLDSIYERNWNKISRLPSGDRSRALNILRWATSAVRPLTVAELTEALLVSDGDETVDLQLDDLPDSMDDEYIASEISGLCGSLVEVSRMDPGQSPELWTIHLRHFSVRQFLLTKNAEMKLSSSDSEMRNSLRTGNNHLAVICLRYLRDPSVQKDLRSQGGRRRFADYAVQFWPRHVSRQGLRYGDVSQITTDFFTSDAPDWTTWRSHFHHLQSSEVQEKESDEEVKEDESDEEVKEDELDEEVEEDESDDEVEEDESDDEVEGNELDGSDRQELSSPMYYAALFGLEDTIKQLYSKKPHSIDEIGGIHGTPIKAAYEAGHSSLVTEMARLGANLNISAGCHGSLLGCACHSGDLTLCRVLLEQNVNLEAVDGMRRTPLYTACRHGHADVLKLLVERGAELAVLNADNYTPINVASTEGHTEVVRRLLEYHTDLSVAEREGLTPLYSACLNGHLDVVNLLLEHRADLSVPNINGWTPINAASEQGHLEVVKVLLKYGADVSVVQIDGQTPLYSACLHGHSDVVNLLLEHGADPSVPNIDGWTPLNTASDDGYIEIVKQLLAYNADLSIVEQNGRTPLYSACLGGHLEVVKVLLEHGANVSVSNSDSWTPINAASWKGYIEIVKQLLAYNADLSIIEKNGRTPFYSACIKGHLKIVKVLLEHGADVSVSDNEGWTPINVASWKGHIEIIKLLLEYNVDLSITQEDGRTPLHSACFNGHLEVAKLLLEQGADISTTTTKGWTPLHEASDQGHSDIVKLLIECKADISAVVEGGSTSLLLASRDGHLKVVKILLDHKADTSVTDEDGCTALFIASRHNNLDVIRLLLENKADTSIADYSGWTPLFIALYIGRLEVVKALLDYKADASITNKRGRTPLYIASQEGCIDIVKLLLEYKADISTTNELGQTPLYVASQEGYIDIVKLLLEYKADTSVTDKRGRTPLFIASQEGHIDIVKMLLEQGADASVADKRGQTPMHVVSDKGHLDIAKLLIANGSDPRSITRLSETSLHLASRRDVVEMVDLLMAHGYDAEQMDDYGRTHLDWALQCPVFVSSRKWASEHVPTPEVASKRVLQRTIARLVDQALSEKTTESFYVLSKCLLLAGDELNAFFALQQVFSAVCDRCGSMGSLIRDHYACMSCADVDLYGECFRIFREDEEPWRCHSHEFVQVLRDESRTPSQGLLQRDSLEWLIAMREQSPNLLK